MYKKNFLMQMKTYSEALSFCNIPVNLLHNNRRSHLKKKASALKRELKEECLAEQTKSELLNSTIDLSEDSPCPALRKQVKSKCIKNGDKRKCNLLMLLAKFKRHCQKKIEKGLKLGILFELMECYGEIIKPAVSSFYKASKETSKLESGAPKKHMFDVSKLKPLMRRMLMFFHMYYSAINTPTERAVYLEIMSDLMSMYVDMEMLEVESSCTKTENIMKIASIITSTFMVLFGGNADDYILDCLLKSHIPTRPSLLYDLIFRSVLRNVPEQFIDALSYIRYLLVFKLWESIVETEEQKSNIKKISILLLKPPITFREEVADVESLQRILPTIPDSYERNNITAFLMECKFSLNEAIKSYFITSDDPKVLLYTRRIVPNSSVEQPKKIEVMDPGNDDDYLVQSECYYRMDYEEKFSELQLSDLSRKLLLLKEENFLLSSVLPDDMVVTDCLPSSTESEPWSILEYLKETSQIPPNSADRGELYDPVERFYFSPNRAETAPQFDEGRMLPSSSTDIILTNSNADAYNETSGEFSQIIMNENIVSSSSENKTILKDDNHNRSVPKEATKRKLSTEHPVLRKSPRLKRK